MALATYADLLTAVQDYEDDSSAVVTGRLADMVTLAEQRIFLGGEPGTNYYTPPLRVRAMERRQIIPIGPGLAGGTSTGSANVHALTLSSAPTLVRGLTVTFTAGYSNTGAITLDVNSTGVITVKKGAGRDDLAAGDILAGGIYTVYYDGTNYVLMASDGAAPLPANFLGVKSAYLQDRGVWLTPQTATGVNVFMDGAVAGEPEYYAIEGDTLRIEPLPDDDYKLALTYYERPAALSSALNDIFRQAPAIYLYATLFELALYLPNPEAADKWFAQFRSALNGFVLTCDRSSTSYSPGRVRLRLAP
jgi:hypothetical protein